MLKLLLEGGYLMVPLAVCSVLTLAVLLDRAHAFWIHSQIDTRALRARVLELVGDDRVDEAGSLCASTPSPVSAVLLVGLQSYAKHRSIATHTESLMAIMEKAMEDHTRHAISAVEKRFSVLSTIGSAAPLLGMTGTVTGMIASFGHLASAGVESAGVAAGISEALVTTATGLVIALAAVIPYNYFVSLSEQIELEIQEASSELIDLVVTQAAAAGRKEADTPS